MDLKNKHLFIQQAYIDGEWVSSSNQIEVFNPATQEKIGSVPNFGTTETKQAIQSAKVAMQSWKKLTARQRSDILYQWYQLIIDNIDDLAKIMTIEQGKPFIESMGEIKYGANFILWFAEEGKRVYGDIIPTHKVDARILVKKEPIGVVGAITPWNFPHAMITRKCAPGLAVGCSFVVKPSSLTPFSALALAYLAEKAGLPKGLLNVVTGSSSQIGKELTTNFDVKKISFTGSTEVGKILLEQGASTIKKMTMELGGNAPLIIFDDGDLEKAIPNTMLCKFRNSGQTCVCANRIFIQEGIYQKAVDRFVEETEKIHVGNGLEANVTQGPMINEEAILKVESLIADAVSQGAKVLTGGQRSKVGNSYFEPTVLVDVTDDMLIHNEEIFGPVATLYKFKTDEEVIERANNTEFGLASYFFTENLARSIKVSEALEYGIVGVNEGIISTEIAPFGGVKMSGLGREGSKYGIEDYVNIKYVLLGGL